MLTLDAGNQLAERASFSRAEVWAPFARRALGLPPAGAAAPSAGGAAGAEPEGDEQAVPVRLVLQLWPLPCLMLTWRLRCGRERSGSWVSMRTAMCTTSTEHQARWCGHSRTRWRRPSRPRVKVYCFFFLPVLLRVRRATGEGERLLERAGEAEGERERARGSDDAGKPSSPHLHSQQQGSDGHVAALA